MAEAKHKLSASKRLELIRLLNALPGPQFDELVFAIAPPSGIIPGNTAPQGNRSAALLQWVESPVGPGLADLEAVLASLVGSHSQSTVAIQPEGVNVLREVIASLRQNQQNYDQPGAQGGDRSAEAVQRAQKGSVNGASKKRNSGNSWQGKLIFPMIIGLALAGTSPLWIPALGNLFGNNDPPAPVPSPTITPAPNPAPTAPEPIPAPDPVPTPDPASAPASREIREQGYIFRVEGCRTTGEVGAVVCDFMVEAESERKDLSVISRNTSLVDPNGQSYRASRMDFGDSGSDSSARSELNPGVPIRGTATFSGIPSGVSSFPSFELGGYSYGDGNWTATFYEIPLAN